MYDDIASFVRATGSVDNVMLRKHLEHTHPSSKWCSTWKQFKKTLAAMEECSGLVYTSKGYGFTLVSSNPNDAAPATGAADFAIAGPHSAIASVSGGDGSHGSDSSSCGGGDGGGGGSGSDTNDGSGRHKTCAKIVSLDVECVAGSAHHCDLKQYPHSRIPATVCIVDVDGKVLLDEVIAIPECVSEWWFDAICVFFLLLYYKLRKHRPLFTSSGSTKS